MTIVGITGIRWNTSNSEIGLYDILARALSKTNLPMASILTEIEMGCSNSLRLLFNGERGAEARMGTDRTNALQILVAKWREDIPEFYILSFNMRTNESHVEIALGAKNHSAYHQPLDGSPVRCMLGVKHNAAISRLHNDSFWKGDPRQRITELIKMEIKEAPKDVNYPIFIMQLDKTGSIGSWTIGTNAVSLTDSDAAERPQKDK